MPPHWVVDCRRVGRGEPALQYLSRYLYRGVIRERDLLDYDHIAGTVTFRYRDAQTREPALRTLPIAEFLWRVLSHVLLPDGFALNLGFKEYAGRRYLKEAFIGQKDPQAEQIHPGLRTYDGSYTELTLRWQGLEVFVQSATDGDDLVLLVTPKTQHRKTPLVVVEPGLLWNRPGSARICISGGNSRLISAFSFFANVLRDLTPG